MASIELNQNKNLTEGHKVCQGNDKNSSFCSRMQVQPSMRIINKKKALQSCSVTIQPENRDNASMQYSNNQTSPI